MLSIFIVFSLFLLSVYIVLLFVDVTYYQSAHNVPTVYFIPCGTDWNLFDYDPASTLFPSTSNYL